MVKDSQTLRNETAGKVAEPPASMWPEGEDTFPVHPGEGTADSGHPRSGSLKNTKKNRQYVPPPDFVLPYRVARLPAPDPERSQLNNAC